VRLWKDEHLKGHRVWDREKVVSHHVFRLRCPEHRVERVLRSIRGKREAAPGGLTKQGGGEEGGGGEHSSIHNVTRRIKSSLNSLFKKLLQGEGGGGRGKEETLG